MDQAAQAGDERARREQRLELVERVVERLARGVDLKRGVDVEEERRERWREELDRRLELSQGHRSAQQRSESRGQQTNEAYLLRSIDAGRQLEPDRPAVRLELCRLEQRLHRQQAEVVPDPTFPVRERRRRHWRERKQQQRFPASQEKKGNNIRG